jgi:hypothetical protein
MRIIRAQEQMHQCESLYGEGRIYDVAESLLAIANTIGEDIGADKSIADRLSGALQRRTLKKSIQRQLSEFMHRCATKLERVGDKALNAKKQDEAVSAYSTALSLSSSIPDTVLVKWATMMLKGGSAHEALSAAAKVYFI